MSDHDRTDRFPGKASIGFLQRQPCEYRDSTAIFFNDCLYHRCVAATCAAPACRRFARRCKRINDTRDARNGGIQAQRSRAHAPLAGVLTQYTGLTGIGDVRTCG